MKLKDFVLEISCQKWITHFLKLKRHNFDLKKKVHGTKNLYMFGFKKKKLDKIAKIT